MKRNSSAMLKCFTLKSQIPWRRISHLNGQIFLFFFFLAVRIDFSFTSHFNLPLCMFKEQQIRVNKLNKANKAMVNLTSYMINFLLELFYSHGSVCVHIMKHIFKTSYLKL